jgi:hypothetical protein
VLFYEIAIGIISSKRHVRFASKGSFRKHVSNDMQSRGETVPPVIENKTPDRDPEAVESMDVGCPEQGKQHDELLERMRADGTIRFQLDDAVYLQDTKFSNHMWVRSLPWRLMVMPRPGQGPRKSLGVFMQCCVQEISAEIPTGWSCLAVVTFKAFNHLEGKEDRIKKVDHTFDAKENDWGFPSFLTWEVLCVDFCCDGIELWSVL